MKYLKWKKKSEWLPCFWATIQCGSTRVQRCRSCNRQTLLQETHLNYSKREHHTCFYVSDFFTFSVLSSFHHPVLPKHFLQIGIKKTNLDYRLEHTVSIKNIKNSGVTSTSIYIFTNSKSVMGMLCLYFPLYFSPLLLLFAPKML